MILKNLNSTVKGSWAKYCCRNISTSSKFKGTFAIEKA